jgi:hypothetical protein
MNTHASRTVDPCRRQGGAVLFTVLVFLLVLTVLGVFGLNRARLETRMAANALFRTQALNDAEYVLTTAEHDLRTLAGNPFHPDVAGDAYYAQEVTDFDPDTPGIQQPADRVWTFSHALVSLPDLDGDGRAGDGTGRYVIQDAGTALAPDRDRSLRSSILHVPPGVRVQAFLVTAQAGAARGAQRTVQSIVVTEPLEVRRGLDARPADRRIDRIGWIDLQP